MGNCYALEGRLKCKPSLDGRTLQIEEDMKLEVQGLQQTRCPTSLLNIAETKQNQLLAGQKDLGRQCNLVAELYTQTC